MNCLYGLQYILHFCFSAILRLAGRIGKKKAIVKGYHLKRNRIILSLWVGKQITGDTPLIEINRD
jgi:hypothetical protein